MIVVVFKHHCTKINTKAKCHANVTCTEIYLDQRTNVVVMSGSYTSNDHLPTKDPRHEKRSSRKENISMLR